MTMEYGRGDIRNLPPEIIGFAIQNPEWGQRAAHMVAEGNVDDLREQLAEAGFDPSEQTIETLMSLDHGRIHDGLESIKDLEVFAA